MLSLSLLARPFSRPSDLKSRSCSSEGFISAGAVRAAGSYLASSFIGGGFGRLSRRHFPAARRWPCFKSKKDKLDSQLACV